MFRGLGRLIVFTVAAVGFRVSVPIQMQALWALVRGLGFKSIPGL